jgi:hypothetical protein
LVILIARAVDSRHQFWSSEEKIEHGSCCAVHRAQRLYAVSPFGDLRLVDKTELVGPRNLLARQRFSFGLPN